MRIGFFQDRKTHILIIVFMLISGNVFSQKEKTKLSIAVEPGISWFSSDHRQVRTDGLKTGISFGLVVDNYFGEKYAVSTGAFMMYTGGKMSYTDTVDIVTAFDTLSIPGGIELNYGLQYLAVPFGLKLETVEIGYTTFYVELGVKALLRLGSKASAPNNLLNKEKISDEISFFNLAWSIGGGFEYSIGGSTSLIGGLYFNNSFIDITKDRNNKPEDYLRLNSLSLRMGILF